MTKPSQPNKVDAREAAEKQFIAAARAYFQAMVDARDSSLNDLAKELRSRNPSFSFEEAESHEDEEISSRLDQCCADFHASDIATSLYDQVLHRLKPLMPQDTDEDCLNDGSETDFVIQSARIDAEACVWIWEDRPRETDAGRATDVFTLASIDHFDGLNVTNWVGCVPIELRFSGFPPVSNLPPIRIFNPIHETRAAQNDDWDEFKSLLKKECGLQTPPALEMSAPAETERALKSAVLNRPQLVVNLRSGEEAHCVARLRDHLRTFLPLLRLCQLIYSIDRQIVTNDSNSAPVQLQTFDFHPLLIDLHSGKAKSSDWNTRYPEQKRSAMDAMLCEPDPQGRACERAGELHPLVPRLLALGHTAFESADQGRYDFDEFQKVWFEFANPILQLKRLAGGPRVDRRFQIAIDRSILVMSTSLYGLGAGLVVNTVLATETLVDPFEDQPLLENRDPQGDSLLKRVAWLAGDDRARLFGRLYKFRNSALHSAKLIDDESPDLIHKGRDPGRYDPDVYWDDNKTARELLSLYRECLTKVVKWAKHTSDGKKRVDRKSFKLFIDN